jgi:hydroxymethylbilane synthase
MNSRLNGGCQVPIAGFAQLDGEQLHLRGLVGSPDGGLIYRSQSLGHWQEAELIGQKVAEDLLAQGADKILSALLN